MTSTTTSKTGARRPSGSSAPGPGSRSGAIRPSGLPWILPAFVFVVGILYYCIGETGYLSTLDWDGTSPTPTSVGLQNYQDILVDPIFWQAIWHTVIFFLVTFTAQTAIGFTFAALLHSKVRLATVYKVIVFTPVVIAPATMAPVFRQMFAADGQLNWFLDHVGLGFLSQPWLAQSSTAMPVIMFITVWNFTGLTFVLYYAAMGQIDPEVLEAARTDGASNLRTLVSIVWPGVRSTTVALAMLSVIGALKTFDIPYLVTIGGPNYATEFLGTYIYRISIPSAHVGYGAALSIMLLVLALLGAIAVAARSNRKDGESGV
ncbi:MULTISPECIES: sugar ABC transporter permease [Herbidospora]|uniref:carbohydrate ABC transporter permease n=1 Tax=Herbidospora TaxID=28443 RepID=UPI001929F836|nr:MULTISPECIES: sugar ABC transporter permease [Herbidospora]GLX93767.1 sugar ABC transporter permease [Herbidospora sp. NBRC 101105]